MCDGVGGYENGDVASKLVIRSITQYLNTTPIEPICTNCIVNSIKFAQSELNKEFEDSLSTSKTGTTIALLFVQKDYAITAHMGDSRIMFLKYKSNNFWTTKDHSLVQELFDANVLKSAREMQNHPMKNKITNAISTGQDEDEVRVTTHELHNIASKDKFMLFTDGVLETLTPDDLISIVTLHDLLGSMTMISEKVKKTSRDNSTFVLLEI